jgi:hypothetical protein
MSLLNLLMVIKRRPANRHRKIAAVRLRIEVLEDRALPSISWVAGGPGEWNDPNNWKDDMNHNRLPGPSDDVSLPAEQGTYMVSQSVGVCRDLSFSNPSELKITSGLHVEGTAHLNGDVTVGGGNVALDLPTTINGAVTLSDSGSLNFPTGAAATTSSFLNGPVMWAGGFLYGGTDANPLWLNAGNTMTIAGPDPKTIYGLLDVAQGSQVVHQGGNLTLNGTLNNEGVYDLQTDANVGILSSYSFLNTGTGILRKSAGSGTATVGAFVNTGGRVEGHAGTLRLQLATNSTDAGGAFDVAAGALVDLASTGTAGNLPVFTGAFTGSGRGTVRLETSIGVGAAGAAFNFPGPVDPPNGNGSQIFSHLTGAENGISDITAPINSLVGVFLGPDQPDQSPAPDALDFSTDASRDYAVLAPALKQVFFIGDGLTSTGDPHKVIVPDGATRLFLGTMDGFEWRNDSGAFSVRINQVNGGNFPVLVPGISDPWLAGLPNGSTASIDDVAPYQSPAKVPGLTLSAGDALTFAASGSVNFFPTMFEWTNGQIGTGAGGMLTNGGFMRIAGPDAKHLVNTLNNNNNGTIIHTGGTLYVEGNAALNNQGTYDLQMPSVYPLANIAGLFNNAGTLRKSVSADYAYLQGSFNNNGGTVDVQNGKLDLPSGTQAGGTFFTADGTTLGLFSGTVTGTYTGWTAGSGVVSVTSGFTVGAGGATFNFQALRWAAGSISTGPDPLINAGSITLTGTSDHPLQGSFTNDGTVIITAGYLRTLRVTGDYTQSMSGTLDIELGSSPVDRQYGLLTVYGTATLAGTLQVDLVNGYGGNPGDVFGILTFGSLVADFDNVILPPGAVRDALTGTVRF